MTDEELGEAFLSAWLDRSLPIQASIVGVASRVGAMVRLIREATEYVKTVYEQWGPDEESIAWLDEARVLAGEEPGKEST